MIAHFRPQLHRDAWHLPQISSGDFSTLAPNRTTTLSCVIWNMQANCSPNLFCITNTRLIIFAIKKIAIPYEKKILYNEHRIETMLLEAGGPAASDVQAPQPSTHDKGHCPDDFRAVTFVVRRRSPQARLTLHTNCPRPFRGPSLQHHALRSSSTRAAQCSHVPVRISCTSSMSAPHTPHPANASCPRSRPSVSITQASSASKLLFFRGSMQS